MHFRPNTRTGRISRGRCISDDATTEGDEAGCGGRAPGLNGAFSVAVTPDGRNVYAVGATSDTLVQFDRNTTDGSLTFRGCAHDGSPDDGCTGSSDGLNQPRSVAVSPDGESVYVVSQLSDAIVHFRRDPGSGFLTAAGCLRETPADSCAGGADGLTDPYSVTVSRDGRNVYVAGYFSDSVAVFNREAKTGRITPSG